MSAAARLGVGRRDRRNQHQRRHGYRQCQKPDRKFAHASLPRWGRPCGSPLIVHRAGKNIPVANASPRASHAPSIRVSLRIFIHRRRPFRTLEASGAGRVLSTGRPAHRPRLTGRPGNAEAVAPLLLMLLDMPAAARLGLGWCDHRNQHQRRRGYRQRQQPDRKFAHAFLPRWGQAMLGPLMLHRAGTKVPAAIAPADNSLQALELTAVATSHRPALCSLCS
jgi:hypothetical protein